MKSLLRFITCGSVDDGKSTLIGRLLVDSNMIFDDQLTALRNDSRRAGGSGEHVDLALLVDGLAAEREQGITIDVAYRYFSTEKRQFIVADTPGHEQYTRNMVTGASTADAAIILVDARKGVLTQTRRHAYLVQLIGIRHVVLAVNKMDSIDYDPLQYRQVVDSFAAAANAIGITQFTAVPVSGLVGDNVISRSTNTPWFQGPTLVEYLDRVEIDLDADQQRPLRLPVQWVNRPSMDFRGYSGMIAAGVLRTGDAIRVLPSGTTTTVRRILGPESDLPHAVAGQSVTVCFQDDIDCPRGAIISQADDAPEVADQFEATIVWMADEPMLPGRPYFLKLATQTVSAQVQAPKYEINVNSMAHLPATSFALNAIGVANLSTDRPIAFEPYAQSRELGGFILIDKNSHATVAAGMLHFALRRAHNIHRQPLSVAREFRAKLKNQRAALLWFTGLSGAGKSTIANLVESKLARMNRHTFLLDGDNVRHGLSRDLGFSDADRVENIRRVGEVARLLTDAGLIVITAFISPFRAEREMVRQMIAPGEFLEVYIDTALASAEARDVKGLYRKARAGQLKNFTGIDSPYEPPESPEIHIDTGVLTADAAANLIVNRLIDLDTDPLGADI